MPLSVKVETHFIKSEGLVNPRRELPVQPGARVELRAKTCAPVSSQALLELVQYRPLTGFTPKDSSG
jgi:hypothetical protein